VSAPPDRADVTAKAVFQIATSAPCIFCGRPNWREASAPVLRAIAARLRDDYAELRQQTVDDLAKANT
jgi:hypothetical protein